MKTKTNFISVLVIILALMLMITACGATSTSENTGTREPITTATTPSEDMTEPCGETTEPSTAPSEPSTEVTEPSTNTTEPSTDTTEPSGHIHSYTETKTAPGCETEGYTTYTCACGDTFTGDNVPATGHEWGEWVTTKEPTTSATGSAERSCAACGSKETKVLDKVVAGHSHSYSGEVTKAATCSAEGVKTYTCTCGSSYTESIAKTAHSYQTSVTKPTCTAKGYTTYKCGKCSDTYKADYVNAKGHSYTSKVTKNATCTSEGTKTYTCTCGSSYTEKIAKAAHKYTDTVVKPTCTKEGYTTHKCSVCGSSYTDAKKVATGHSYSSKVTTPATCSKDGVKTYTCSKCSHSYTEAVKGGHSWKHVHIDEVGHVEVWLVCRCGWTCTTEDAANAGYTAEKYGDDYTALVMYWDGSHKNQKPVSDRKNHSYDTPDEWVVDTPAEDYDVCTECGTKK